MTGEINSIPPTVDTVVLSSTGSTSPPWIPVDGDDATSNVDAGVDVVGTETLDNFAIPLPVVTSPLQETAGFSERAMSETLKSDASKKGKPPFLDPSSLVALGER